MEFRAKFGARETLPFLQTHGRYQRSSWSIKTGISYIIGQFVN